MKAALVHTPGALPTYEAFTPPATPPGALNLRVDAAALSRLTRARAAGRHYSAGAVYPFVPGVDGVGRDESGRRLYFAFPPAPWGAMAEEVAISPAQTVPVPDALDDVTAAALANPGMSGWMALRERAGFKPGETVLINGATGSSGSLAVQIARHLGAGRIIATGRNRALLDRLDADRTIPLGDGPDALRDALHEECARGVDIVLDYLWGESAQAILGATRHIPDPARPLRFVQIGSVTGETAGIEAAWLRARATVMMGSGLGSVAQDRIMASIGALLAVAPAARFRLETETAPLADVTANWTRDTGNSRLVFLP